MNDRDKDLAREYQEQYKFMLQSGAWKDFANYMDELVKESNRETDNCEIEDLTVTKLAHARGMRDALERLRKHVNFRLAGGMF